MLRLFSRLARVVAVGALASVAHAQGAAGTPAGPSVALFYGANPPVEQLSAFDVVVVEPDAKFDPRAHAKTHPAWFAYVSVGEVNAHRSYFSAMPSAWLSGENKAWASKVVDQTAPGWPAFFVDKVIAPLWKRGYRGFFLDTLDSYQLIARTDAARAAQEAGLVNVIRAIKARYPKAKLIFNRGFEVLPQVHDLAYVVAFESLYRGWDAGKQQEKRVGRRDPSCRTRSTPNFITVPAHISMWGNDVHGDCVTAEEAFAKACNNPEIFIPDSDVISWATNHSIPEKPILRRHERSSCRTGFLARPRVPDGLEARPTGGFSCRGNIVSVLQWMQYDGFQQGSTTYDDGSYFSVNWTDSATLPGAVQNLVKIGVAADQTGDCLAEHRW